jgi:hypothetical protein
VLLQVVSFAGNVNRTFLLIRKTHTCDLSQSGVRLLGRSRGYGQTYATFLRTVVQNRALGLIRLLFSTFLDELVNSRHFVDLLVKILEYIFKIALMQFKEANLLLLIIAVWRGF